MHHANRAARLLKQTYEQVFKYSISLRAVKPGPVVAPLEGLDITKFPALSDDTGCRGPPAAALSRASRRQTTEAIGTINRTKMTFSPDVITPVYFE